jgi:hypothetical protein
LESRLRALHEVDQQLERLRCRLQAHRPALYRDLALYLQVLRNALPASVQQASFILSTRYAEGAYGDLPSQQRKELHARLSSLVQRCTSLLTVEQLAVLGVQLERRRGRLSADADRSVGPEQAHASASPDSLPLPPGSVRLDLTPPLTADYFGQDLLLPPLPAEDPEPPASPQPSPDPEALQALLALTALTEDHPARPGEGSSSGLLPDDPQAMLGWWQRLDQALERRLRNLSHAINVELLRLGLSRNLLPVHLLDAVLAGHLDPLPAPANLLRLQLPRPEPGPPLEVVGMLLRCSDLEYEQPRLRTCRQRLRRRHQDLRRMAQHFRHWQRRALVLEAEQLWLQDTGAMGHQPPPV